MDPMLKKMRSSPNLCATAHRTDSMRSCAYIGDLSSIPRWPAGVASPLLPPAPGLCASRCHGNPPKFPRRKGPLCATWKTGHFRGVSEKRTALFTWSENRERRGHRLGPLTFAPFARVRGNGLLFCRDPPFSKITPPKRALRPNPKTGRNGPKPP